jgi:G3E family GTPase
MKIKIICGFLGAGKTTLLRNILEESKEKTVVLINEMGDVAIDGAVITKYGALEVMELPSGCICCALRADLIRTVEEILKEINPARLIIEPSGIATPSNILESLKISKIYDSLEIEPVIGVIDATTFLNYYKSGNLGNFFLDQITNSDILLINKCDLVSKEIIDEIEDIIKDLNRSAVIFRTVYCKTPLLEGKRERDVKPYYFDIHLDSFSFETENKFDNTKLKKFLSTLDSGEFGDIIRAKGIIKTDDGVINFNYVPRSLDIEKLESSDLSKFVVIGENLKKELIEERLSSIKI